MPPQGPIRQVSGQRLCGQFGQALQRCVGASGVSQHADKTQFIGKGRAQVQQPAVQGVQYLPVGVAAECPLCVHRLHRCLQLVASRRCGERGTLQLQCCLLHQRHVPQARVLLVQWHPFGLTLRPRPQACDAARLAEQQQCVQSQRFGLRQKRGKQSGQVQRLVGQGRPGRFGATQRGPVQAIGAVDGIQYRAQPRGQCVVGWHFKGDTCVPDLRLGTGQPLPQRGGLLKEGPRHSFHADAQHGLQHQRGLHGRVDGGVRAREEQPQSFVHMVQRLAWRQRIVVLPLLMQRQVVHRKRLVHLCMPMFVAQVVACGGQQPGGRVGGQALAEPMFTGLAQRLCHSVLGCRDVAGARRQQRHQPPLVLAEHGNRGRRYVLRLHGGAVSLGAGWGVPRPPRPVGPESGLPTAWPYRGPAR